MEPASKNRALRPLPRQGYGQRSRKKAKVTGSTTVFNGNGFLKHRFLPLAGERHDELQKWQQVEREFFTSLSHLAKLYLFEPLDVSKKVFPDNIGAAYHHAASQVNAANPQIDLVVLQDEIHAAVLATIKPFNTGSTLYYIPIRPLKDLLADKKQELLANLLLSVYAYLYQVVKIPYYTEASSSLSSTYYMIEEWVKDDPSAYDIEHYTAAINNLNELYWYGKKLLKALQHPYHLQQFPLRVTQFKPTDEVQSKLHKVSIGFLDLFNNYPNRSIFDNIHIGWVDPREEERIYPEQYISFYWDYRDTLYKTLFEVVNTDLQEKSVIEEPLGVQLYDKPQSRFSNHELDFETRLFDLLNDLTSLL